MVTELFASLDGLEERLAGRRYLFGDRHTLADWRLFTTLLRFDPVYHGHFKCNVRRMVDYPALWGYLRDLLSVPRVRETVNMDHIKRHYYMTHPQINPTPGGADRAGAGLRRAPRARGAGLARRGQAGGGGGGGRELDHGHRVLHRLGHSTPERRSADAGTAGPPATTCRPGWRERSRRAAATTARAPAGSVAVRQTTGGRGGRRR